MALEITTVIDGRPFVWHADGEFGWGVGGPLCRLADDPLLPLLGSDGYRIVELPPGCAETAAAGVAAVLGCRPDRLEAYHRHTEEAQHQRLIERTRELRFADLGLDPEPLAALFGAVLGVRLSPIVPGLGRDHVQLRINRPGSTDYNPPHRDAALPLWRETLNVWLPIAGVDADTSLPLAPGSHRISEDQCWQTAPSGVAIAGRRYRVPALAWLRDGPLEMRRAPVVFGQALLFTPCLIHGLAANQSRDRTRMALELRLQVLP